MIGKALGHYKILGKLGAGGMGEVYRARDSKLDRDVAIKVLPVDKATDPERIARFEREAKSIAALKHPNIVTIYSVEDIEGIHFLTMELVEGDTLSSHLQPHGLPLEQVFQVAIPLVDAVCEAHAKNITHRDLKPANVMFDEAGRVKVLDFGLAKLLQPEPSFDDATLATMPDQGDATGEGRVLGTVNYMSPEQAEGKPIDGRSDIFSLGILLYEMASGQRPFHGDTRISTISAILKDAPRPITELNQNLPRHFGRILNHCLAKDPNRRYQSAIDLRNELESLKDEIDSGELRTGTTDIPGQTSDSFTHESSLSALGRQPGIGTSVDHSSELGGSAVSGSGSAGNRRLLVIIPVIIVALGAAWFFGTRAGDSDPATNETTTTPLDFNAVAVLYFENLSDPADEDRLGKITASLLTPALSNTSDLNMISEQRLYDILRKLRKADATIDRNVASEVAREAGAGRVILGQVSLLGDRLSVNSQVIDMQTGTILSSQRAEGQGQESLFRLVDELAQSIVTDLDATPASTDVAISVTEITTASVDAYRHYQNGLAAYQHHRFNDATDELDAALEADPNFAMAHFYRAFPFWPIPGEEQVQYLTRANHFADRATPAERGLITGAYIWLVEEDTQTAVTTLEEFEQQFPEEHRLAFMRGRVHYFGTGNNAAAVEAFEKALQINPDDIYTLNSLSYAYSDLRLHDRAIETMTRYISLDPANPNAYDSLGEIYLRAGSLDKSVEAFEHASTIQSNYFSEVHGAIVEAMQGDFTRAIATLVEHEPDHNVINRFKKALYLALLMSMAGRYQEAQAAVQSGVDVSIIEGTPALAGFICYFGGFIQLQSGAVTDLDCHDVEGRTRVAVPVKFAYEAEVALREGDFERATELINSVRFGRGQDPVPEPEYMTAIDNLRVRLEVEKLVRQGRLDEAMAMKARVRPLVVPNWGPSDFVTTAALNLPLERDTLAQALAEQGRLREAILEYELLVNPDRRAQQYELVPGIYYYRLGKLYEDYDDPPRAADNYRKFLKAWENADANSSQPGDASKRLAAISP